MFMIARTFAVSNLDQLGSWRYHGSSESHTTSKSDYTTLVEGTNMSYETKVILALLAQRIGMAKSVKEAYEAIVMAASVEGLELPSYEDFLKNIGQE